MAEFGSQHFASGIGTKPSIFTILAEESLTSGLRDACRHFCKVLAENFPAKFGPILLHFEELYTLADFIFHLLHFRIYGASFAEYFYDLRRVPNPRATSVSWKRLLMWVSAISLFPYLRYQLETMFKKIREKEADGSIGVLNERLQCVAIFYKKFYPSFHFIWEAVTMYYYMAYSLNKSDYHSPLIHITSARLTNASQDDDFIPDSWEEFLSHQRKIYVFTWKVLKTLIGTATVSVSVGAFFVQFLDWWYDREGKTSILPSMPVPPPPPKWPFTMSSEICPLCQKKRTNDTALSCSGFVFCYPCIFKHIESEKCCPVTGYPASLEELVKIYQQNG